MPLSLYPFSPHVRAAGVPLRRGAGACPSRFVPGDSSDTALLALSAWPVNSFLSTPPWGRTLCLIFTCKNHGDTGNTLSVLPKHYVLSHLCLTLSFDVGFPGGTSGKEPSCQCRRRKSQVQPLGQEDPLEEGAATHSSILAQEVHGQRNSDGLWSMGTWRAT